MKLKRGFLSVIVILLLICLSVSPVINGNVESTVIQSINKDVENDDGLFFQLNEKLDEYKANRDCGCEDIDDQFPIFCSILKMITIVSFIPQSFEKWVPGMFLSMIIMFSAIGVAVAINCIWALPFIIYP